MVPAACPLGEAGKFVQINIQMPGISRKDVIHPKSLVFKKSSKFCANAVMFITLHKRKISVFFMFSLILNKDTTFY